jgi:hypothetical protein
MRSASLFGLVLLFSLGAHAQYRGGGVGVRGGVAPRYGVTQTLPYRTYGSPSGFGNVVFPGMGTAPPMFPTTFVERIGRSVSGFGYTGVGPGYGHGGFGHKGFYGGGFSGAYPVAYPVVVGGGYDYSYQQPYAYQQPPPNITIVMPPQAPPPVTINQYGPEARPEGQQGEGNTRMYQAPSAERPEPADDQVMFFVALKDSSVYTAVAYWVQDSTLHYITPQGRHNQVSIDLVDRDTSARLNDGRKVEFRLPPAR